MFKDTPVHVMFREASTRVWHASICTYSDCGIPLCESKTDVDAFARAIRADWFSTDGNPNITISPRCRECDAAIVALGGEPGRVPGAFGV